MNTGPRSSPAMPGLMRLGFLRIVEGRSMAVFQGLASLLLTPYRPRSRKPSAKRSLTTLCDGILLPSVPSHTGHAEPPPPSAENLLYRGRGVLRQDAKGVPFIDTGMAREERRVAWAARWIRYALVSSNGRSGFVVLDGRSDDERGQNHGVSGFHLTVRC